jgi:hypothetical protein
VLHRGSFEVAQHDHDQDGCEEQHDERTRLHELDEWVHRPGPSTSALKAAPLLPSGERALAVIRLVLASATAFAGLLGHGEPPRRELVGKG